MAFFMLVCLATRFNGSEHAGQLYMLTVSLHQNLDCMDVASNATTCEIVLTPSLDLALSRWNAAVRREMFNIQPISQADLPLVAHSRHSYSRGDNTMPETDRTGAKVNRASE